MKYGVALLTQITIVFRALPIVLQLTDLVCHKYPVCSKVSYTVLRRM